eukprot:scaffold86683_cov61-Phaeocystis_antarctica.AAC.1
MERRGGQPPRRRETWGRTFQLLYHEPVWRKRQSTQPDADRQHTATLPHRTSPISQTPQYPIISLVDMRQPYTLTTPCYFFHSKLQTSNFTGTLSRRMHAAKDR